MVTPNRQLGGDPPDNANEAFFDAIIRHQIGLLRNAGHIRNQIFEILDATEADIRDRIMRLDGQTVTRARLERLLNEITALRSDAWKKSAQVWRDELIAIAKAEPEFVANAMRTVSPSLLQTTLPTAEVLAAIVSQQPFEGRVMREWAQNVRNADLARIRAQIQIGLTHGESMQQIARRVVGTVRQRGRDGVTQISRRDAQGITRTAVIAISNQAKRAFYKLNTDILDKEIYVATLDSRTTPICRSLDGKTFPVGEGPIPPLHFNCRSARVGLLFAEAIGRRPAKRGTTRMLLREYTAANGIRASSRGRLPYGHKGAFDKFARRRMNELTGQVDSKVTYQQWLTRQSAAFQDDVLGPTRGRLFRRGGLDLDRFVNRQGDQITLSQLAGNDAAAFRAAGLDPDDFR